LLALFAGCATEGLSPRESGHQNFSSFVYALYDQPAAQAAAREEAGDAAREPARLVLPARVAVAQVGEVAPPQAFLEKLRGRPDLFSRVEGISGMTGSAGIDPAAPTVQRYGRPLGAYRAGPPTPLAVPDPQEQVRRDVAKMQRLAREMGMDYLLVVGGTIDHATHGNNLALLDLTLVGAFVVPSREINAKATAAAALIDLKSGRVALTASADASKGGLATAATQESGELNVLRQVRDDVTAKLADSLLAECRRVQVAAAN
jgi:hypothetical protein